MISTHSSSYLKSIFKLATSIAVLSIGALTCSAVTYNFGITYDGTTASVDGSSDPIGGTSLNVGDGFILDIHAAGNDFWNVTTGYSKFFDMILIIADSAERTVNVVTTLFLDGSQVQQDIETGIVQQEVHLGNQDFDWITGTSFDQIVIDLDFLAINNGADTILVESADILADLSDTNRPFFNNPNIEYVSGSTSVPDSGTSIALLFASMLALVGLRRKIR